MNVTSDTFEEAVRMLQKAGTEASTPEMLRCDDPARRQTLQAVAKAYGVVARFESQGENT